MQGMHRVPILMASGALLVLLAGCTVTGGGWFANPDGSKTNLGVDVAVDDSGTAAGDVQVNDRSQGIQFHGIPDSGAVNVDGHYAYIFGSYTPQPPVDTDGNVRVGGRFQLYVSTAGDAPFVAVNIGSGAFAGEAVTGSLNGGSLVLAP